MQYIYLLPAAFFAPIIHEWIKALCSTFQGDPTPRNTGYLTANPFKYFEPIGFLFTMAFGFGWGNPTPTTALHYRDRKRGVLVTYLTPVLVNFLLGIGSAALVGIIAVRAMPISDPNILFILIRFSHPESSLVIISLILLANFAFININLALFNLIPVYPLAANKILLQFSRPDTIARLNHYEKTLQVFLILALVPWFGGVGPLARLFWPVSFRIIGFVWGIVV